MAGVQSEAKAVSDAQRSDDKPAARIVLTYEGLPRQSKRFLDKVLQDWAKWHATTYQTEFANDGHFESGIYEYAPATVAAEDITVLVDKPERQKVQAKIAANFNLQYETANEVPKYDRASDAVLLPVRFDRAGELKEPDLYPKAERRCHNCGSYAHTVQGCPHEKNPNEIRERARERGSGGRSTKSNTARYYDDLAATTNSAAGNTDSELADLKPGQLSSETRAALGLGPLDPPPWLDRMRQLGYPPMYKYDKRTDTELFIFDDQTGSDGPKAAAKGTPVPPEKLHFEHGQETIMFPGVNAPMPGGADYALWGEPLPQLPSAAGSKRNQPDYPTQDAASPPLKRIRAEDVPSQPFAFNFQQPGHASVASNFDRGAADHAPFIFSTGTSALNLDTGQGHATGLNAGIGQNLGQQAWPSHQNPYAHAQQHVASPPRGLPPPPASFPHPYASLAVSESHNPLSFSAAATSYSVPFHDTYAHLTHNQARVQSLPQHWHTASGLDSGLSGSILNREGPSAQGLSSIHSYPASSMPAPPPSYFGFAIPPYCALPQHATAALQAASTAYLSGIYQPAASAASLYGTYLPMPSGMHPSYVAVASQSVHANVARLAAADQAVSRPQEAAAPLSHPYAFRYAAPYQHAQSESANTTDTTSGVPPPPPLYPPPLPPF
ncbi:TPA: hypothetical protein ACH3X1_000812 [Trebouxia sp. C0004]